MTIPIRPRPRAAGAPPRRRTTITAVAALLALALALLAGCSRETYVDKVTVSAGTVSVTVPVALSCSAPTGATALTCSGGEDDSNAPHLQLAPGTPVTVSVPKDVGDTPWVIVFSYLDKNGDKKGDRTAVFAAKQRFSYHLETPKGAQLTRLEVQSLIAAQAKDGGVDFPAVRSWVLVVDPA